jgi:heme/copper-type cytochrome/quinol oxidase subunit 1
MGMPRRIPDYADIYYPLNSISSLGSFINLVGLSVFCYGLILSFSRNHEPYDNEITYQLNPD